MGSCEVCCRGCCYSTPYRSLIAIALTALGLLGFIVSSIYGVVVLDSVPHLEDGTTGLAAVVGGVTVLTILPLVLATVLAYCVTGYIRDVLFHRAVKACIGPLCNILVMLTVFLFVPVWLLVVVGLSGIMVYYVQAELFCADVEDGSGMYHCFPSIDTSFNYMEICTGDGLEEVCDDGLKAGMAFSVALIFALLVVLGMVLTLIVAAANFISGKDNYEYRQANSPRSNDYLMKTVH